MAMQPLTHHDILALVEPFTRSGRQLDLAASDRIQRCLAFKPRPSADTAPTPALLDTLVLECPAENSFVLKRTLTHPAGLVATLVATGVDTASLLSCVDAVDPQPLFKSGDGWLMACSFQLKPGPAPSQPSGASAEPRRVSAPAMVLASGVVQVMGLTLQLKMPAVTGYPAELEITTAAAMDLPDDVLQVLGRDWARLTRGAKAWKGALQIRGKEPERTRLAQDKLQAVARHLAQTLSQPPAAFARQQAAARWRVAARRAVPMLTLVALVLGSLAVPYLGIEPDSVYWMLIFNAPPLLLLWGFSLREMPRFELPRPPKNLSAASWWPVEAAAPQMAPANPVGAAATAPGSHS